MHLDPADPAHRDVIAASFARQGFMAHLGARLARVEPGAVDVEVNASASLSQQHGYLHGGVVTALADSACGYAALSLAPAGTEVLTVSLAVNFLAPARGERFIAHAQVVRAGRTVTVARAEVYAHGSGEHATPAVGAGGVHVATLTATLMHIPATAGSNPAPAAPAAPASPITAVEGGR